MDDAKRPVGDLGPRPAGAGDVRAIWRISHNSLNQGSYAASGKAFSTAGSGPKPILQARSKDLNVHVARIHGRGW